MPQSFQKTNNVRAMCVCLCMAIKFWGLSSLFFPYFSSQYEQYDTIVPQKQTHQPPVKSAPPKAQGDHSPCTCTFYPGLTCVAWLAGTLVAIDFVDALPKVTGLALTVVQVHFAVQAYITTEIKQ